MFVAAWADRVPNAAGAPRRTVATPSTCQALVFATGVDAGGADEDWQELEWLFSFTNPAQFFITPPKLH